MILDRDLDLALLGTARRIAVAENDVARRRALLRIALRDRVSEQEANGKTKKCLTRVWLNPPVAAEPLIEWARRVTIEDDDVALQYGALLATFPFVGVVARVVGRALATDGRIGVQAARLEVRRTIGDRPSVDIGARKAYTTLLSLGVLAKAGDYLVRGFPLVIDPRLSTWVIDALLHTRMVETVGDDEVRTAPELLGTVLPEGVRGYDALDAVTEGAGRVVYVPSRRRTPRDVAEIVEIGDNADRVGTVIRMAKRNAQTVGFMPDAAYQERARAGRLLAVVAGNHVEAYVLYDLPRDNVKIIQLVVAENARGSGHARRLVDELCRRYDSRRGVTLRCRNDFEASKVWPRLGFDAVHERPGRSFDGKPLTTWFRSFGHPDLLTLLDAADDRPVAVLDSSVFIALVDPDSGPPIDQLRSDWISEFAKVAVTAELDNELSKAHDGPLRDHQRRIAAGYPHIAPAAEAWETWLAQLKAAHPKASVDDAADLRHIARALATGATWLVVSDGPMRTRYSETAERLGGLRIVRPEQFVLELDVRVRTSEYRPADLAQTSVTRRKLDAGSVDDLARRFVNHVGGEKIGEFRDRLRSLAAQPATITIDVIEHRGTAAALVGRHLTANAIEVPILRVARRIGDRTLARHLAAELRANATEAGKPVVRIVDPHPSRLVAPAASEEGYYLTAGQLEAVNVAGHGTLQHLTETLHDLGYENDSSVLRGTHAVAASKQPAAAARLERVIAPYRICGAGIESFIVPIRPAWATALFATDLAEGQLFNREWRLGLQRELVYYRSPRNAGGLANGSRILWYVSGSDPGSRAIRAISLLDEVVTAPASHLFHRFERLGIYQLTDVIAAADDRGLAMALRFSNTELMKQPVSLDDLRTVLTGDAKSKSVLLLSPRRVSEEVFMALHSRGGGADA